MVNIYFSTLVLGTVLIWFSGKRLVQIVDFICEQTGIGRALMGTVLLGGITSLPEISTTLIAASLGNAELAASNLIGGVGMQTAMLAVADAFILKQALTFIAPNSALLMGGVLLIIQISYHCLHKCGRGLSCVSYRIILFRNICTLWNLHLSIAKL